MLPHTPGSSGESVTAHGRREGQTVPLRGPRRSADSLPTGDGSLGGNAQELSSEDPRSTLTGGFDGNKHTS